MLEDQTQQSLQYLIKVLVNQKAMSGSTANIFFIKNYKENIARLI